MLFQVPERVIAEADVRSARDRLKHDEVRTEGHRGRGIRRAQSFRPNATLPTVFLRRGEREGFPCGLPTK